MRERDLLFPSVFLFCPKCVENENIILYVPLTKPITALPALRPSISPISIGTELPKKRNNQFKFDDELVVFTKNNISTTIQSSCENHEN